MVFGLQILLFVTTLPGYEGDAEQREAVDEEGRGVGNATAAVKDSQQRGQVGGSLYEAGEAEVEMEAGARARDLAHVEREAVEGEGADKPVVVEDQSLGPHVGILQQVQKCLLPLFLSLVDRSQFEVFRKGYLVVFSTFLHNLFCL